MPVPYVAKNVMKGTDGQQEEEVCMTQVQEPHPPDVHVGSPTQKLLEPHTFGIFMEVLSHRLD